jgi:hypothetical protein
VRTELLGRKRPYLFFANFNGAAKFYILSAATGRMLYNDGIATTEGGKLLPPAIGGARRRRAAYPLCPGVLWLMLNPQGRGQLLGEDGAEGKNSAFVGSVSTPGAIRAGLSGVYPCHRIQIAI